MQKRFGLEDCQLVHDLEAAAAYIRALGDSRADGHVQKRLPITAEKRSAPPAGGVTLMVMRSG